MLFTDYDFVTIFTTLGIKIIPRMYNLSEEGFYCLVCEYTKLMEICSEGKNISPKVLILSKPEKIGYRNRYITPECFNILEKTMKNVL